MSRDKGNADQSSVSDDEIFAVSKNLTNSVGVTDDVDGVASIEDDQVAHLFKVVSNASHISDSDVKLTSKVVTDATQSSDSGSIRAQNYTVDVTYFTEDYVGQSSTF